MTRISFSIHVFCTIKQIKTVTVVFLNKYKHIKDESVDSHANPWNKKAGNQFSDANHSQTQKIKKNN